MLRVSFNTGRRSVSPLHKNSEDMQFIIAELPLPVVLTASDEALQQDIRYTDAELDQLIQRTIDESKTEELTDPAKKADRTFAFARVWEGGSRGLTSLNDAEADNVQDQRSFWDSILQANQEEERALAPDKEVETGRGYRKRRDVAYTVPEFDIFPKKRKTSAVEDDNNDDADAQDDDFQMPDDVSASDDSEAALEGHVDDDDVIFLPNGISAGQDQDPKTQAEKVVVAAAERKRRKREARFQRAQAKAQADALAHGPAMGSHHLPPPASHHLHPAPAQPRASTSSTQSTHHTAPQGRKSIPVARMEIPDFTGRSDHAQLMDLKMVQLSTPCFRILLSHSVCSS